MHFPWTSAGSANSAQRSIEQVKDHPQSLGSLDEGKAQEDSVTGGLEHRQTTTLPEGDNCDNDAGVSKLQTTQVRSVLRVCSENSSQHDVRVSQALTPPHIIFQSLSIFHHSPG